MNTISTSDRLIGVFISWNLARLCGVSTVGRDYEVYSSCQHAQKAWLRPCIWSCGHYGHADFSACLHPDLHGQQAHGRRQHVLRPRRRLWYALPQALWHRARAQGRHRVHFARVRLRLQVQGRNLPLHLRSRQPLAVGRSLRRIFRGRHQREGRLLLCHAEHLL